MLSSIFEQFIKESPVSVMMQALMSHIFAPERMDRLFTKHAQVQYQQDLLFSSQVDLMSLVVCGVQKSVHAAYKARAANLSVSTTALYNKLCGVELSVSQALVRETAKNLAELVKLVGGEQANILPGYCIKIVDGTCLKGTDHRLKAIRNLAASALPGKAIVVLEPLSKLVTDIFLIEDGHAQERSEFDSVLKKVEAKDLWCGDRNFCTLKFLFTIQEKEAFFVIRQHRGMMIAIPTSEWEIFQSFSTDKIAQLLQKLSTGVHLKKFLKATRGAKKTKVPVIYDRKKGHISTNRLLEEYNQQKKRS
ncbi:MAG: transposase [Nostoc sp.]|uniref:transposase n=1 Tax=Nostoc sp. TaxID=1180 RepID=UPI002FFD10BE